MKTIDDRWTRPKDARVVASLCPGHHVSMLAKGGEVIDGYYCAQKEGSLYVQECESDITKSVDIDNILILRDHTNGRVIF